MGSRITEIYNLIKQRKMEKSSDKLQEINNDILDIIDCDMFANVLKSSIGFSSATPEEKIIYDSIRNLAIDKDFGYLIPFDIQNDVKSLRQEDINLEELVTVEPIIADEGCRVYDLSAEISPLDTVNYGEDIVKIDPSNLIEVKFGAQRKAAIIDVTLELFKDSNKILINWLKKWCAKKTRATRNKMIIDKINEITLETEIVATDIATLRSVVLTNLTDKYKSKATALMNYAGYDYLDNLYNAAGIKIETIKDGKLFGVYPVKILPDNLHTNKIGNISITIGSFKEAIVLYDRGNMLLDINKVIGFYKDYISIKLIEKLDVKGVDTNAIIKVSIAI